MSTPRRRPTPPRLARMLFITVALTLPALAVAQDARATLGGDVSHPQASAMAQATVTIAAHVHRRLVFGDHGSRWPVPLHAAGARGPHDVGFFSPSGDRLAAVPTHRVFWFGWFAQHPTTLLLP